MRDYPTRHNLRILDWWDTRPITDEEFDQIARAEGYVMLGGLHPTSAAKTLREVAVLVSRGLDVADLLTAIAAALEGDDDELVD